MNVIIRDALLAVTVFMCAGVSAHADDTTIQAGEIQLKGKIVGSALGSAFLMDVQQVKTSNGSIIAISPPRGKNIEGNATIDVMTNGIAATDPTARLQEGDLVLAIGRNSGDGQPLSARVIVMLSHRIATLSPPTMGTGDASQARKPAWLHPFRRKMLVPTSDKYSPCDELYDAAMQTKPAWVNERIHHGDNVNEQFAPSGETPLMLAAKGPGDFTAEHWQDWPLACVTALIAAGANVNARDSYGDTALMFALGGKHQINVKCAKALIAAGADVNAKDNEGDSALSAARYLHSKDLIAILKAAGALE